jgi:hypothetical protein
LRQSTTGILNAVITQLCTRLTFGQYPGFVLPFQLRNVAQVLVTHSLPRLTLISTDKGSEAFNLPEFFYFRVA